MSNNSIVYYQKPTRDMLHWQIEQMRYSGEPAFINMESALKRNPNAKGVNPCSEIILDDRQSCNLTVVNMMAFVDDNGNIDYEGLYKAQTLSARMAYRMTAVDIEMHDWKMIQHRDRLLGCDLTGQQDFINATNIDMCAYTELIKMLKEIARYAADKIADENKLNRSLLVTAGKPNGCWTKEYTRTLDEGILFIDEIYKDIDNTQGFTDIEEGLHFKENKINKVYKNDIKDILKITLNNNRILKVTKEHPMSVKGKWVEAQNLKTGDKIDYSLGNYKNTKHIELKDVSIDEFRSDIRDYKTPTIMSNDLAWLIGAYMANGCFTTNDRIKFSCQHYDVVARVQEIWSNLFEVETNITKHDKEDVYTLEFRSTKIMKWLRENGLLKYDENGDMTKIPLPIRMSSYTDVLSFIVGYADNDGHYYRDSFCIDSSNETFIRHLQEVGEAVGICFNLSVNKERSNSYSKSEMYKIYMSRTYTTKAAIDFINKNSIKLKMTNKKVSSNHRVCSKHPYKVKEIEILKNEQTYDIEVNDIHWYYQGGLKSHNTLALLPTVSAGCHYSHSPYYVRRIRISSNDPLCSVIEDLGYPMHPENGQEWETCDTKVVEFPVKSPEGKTKYDVSAIEQLEYYKMLMNTYVDMNQSITVHVRNNEWEDVEQWMWDNWDSVVGISFLSLDDSFYPLLPYEAITKEEYEKRLSEMKPFNPELISKYEKVEFEGEGVEDAECKGGCGVR